QQRRRRRSPNQWRRSRRVPQPKQTCRRLVAAGVVEAVDAAPIVWVSAVKLAVRKVVPADLPTPSRPLRTLQPIFRATSRQPQAQVTWRALATRPSNLMQLQARLDPSKWVRSLLPRPASAGG